MTEQQLSAQNPRELTANELDQVAGGAADNMFPGRTAPGQADHTLNQAPFFPTTFTGSAEHGNTGANGSPPPGNGAVNINMHTPV
jgi:hypothetical protein